jgi:hypothetical protein
VLPTSGASLTAVGDAHSHAYTPPGTRGAYAERGPVFIHALACDGYLTPDRYPPALSHRQQVVRAYDADGQIADG